jgi:tetratricopeptide (TPR) repeat protein
MPDENALDELLREARAANRDDREPVAIELLASYLRHRANDAEAWRIFADALYEVGRFRECERALFRATELGPAEERIDVSLRIARLYYAMGRHAEAERYYLDVTSDKRWSDHGWLWIMRGANLARLGDFPLAEKCHRAALQCCYVDIDEAWLNIGLVLRAQAKYADAAQALHKCLEIEPSCANARVALSSMNGIEAAIARVDGIESL